jgi:hypothetical protein
MNVLIKVDLHPNGEELNKTYFFEMNSSRENAFSFILEIRIQNIKEKNQNSNTDLLVYGLFG